MTPETTREQFKAGNDYMVHYGVLTRCALHLMREDQNRMDRRNDRERQEVNCKKQRAQSLNVRGARVEEAVSKCRRVGRSHV